MATERGFGRSFFFGNQMVSFKTPGSLGASATRKIDSGTRIRTASPAPQFKGKTGTPDTKNEQGSSSVERQNARREANETDLKNGNVKAFLVAISKAEGGDYDLMYGGVKGKKNDKWRIKDYSTHPGAGSGGKTTAAGMYQINKDTWKDFGVKRLGITDFTAAHQDLIAIEIFRYIGAMSYILSGDLPNALSKTSTRWSSLPMGPKQGNRQPGQPHVSYEKFVEFYTDAGGTQK